MRIYNPSLGRFLSIDPISNDYPMLTPYQFASNRPIDGIDVDGLEWLKYRGWTEGYDKAGILAIGANIIANTVIGGVNAVAGVAMGAKDAAVYSYKVASGQANLVNDAKAAYNGVSSGVKNFVSKPAGEQTKIIGNAITSPEAYGSLVGFLSLGGGNFAKGAIAADAVKSFDVVFSSGATKLISSEMLAGYEASTTYGPLAGTFVAPTAEIDALLNQGLSRIEIAKKLGITDKKFLQGDLIRIDITPDELKKLNLRSATGTETGANSKFIKGGKTAGGITEGVVNGIPKKAKGVSSKKVE